MCRLLVINKNSYDFLEDQIRMYVHLLGLPIDVDASNASPNGISYDILITELPCFSTHVPAPDVFPSMKRVFLSDIPYEVPEEDYLFPRTMCISDFYKLMHLLAPDTVHRAVRGDIPERWFHNYDPILDRVVQVLEIIQSEYVKDLSLNYLAQKVYSSPCYLSTLFTTYMGISPIAYINEYRMKVSANLLATTDIKITDICQMVSPRSFSYFCTCFKNRYHMTPTEYRERYSICRVS